MAKRYTDTDKWNDDWYISLNNDCRIIWQWLLDNCDHAGVLKPGVKLLNFSCNTNITSEELLRLFSGRLLFVNNVYFLPKFIKFQYPDGLKSKKPVILSVLKILTKNDLIPTLRQSLGNDYEIIEELLNNDSPIIKDKDKDKDKDMDKDKSGGAGGELIYDAQEFVLGRQKEFEAMCITLRKLPDPAKVSLEKYHQWNLRENKYPMHGRQVMAGFRLWLMNEKGDQPGRQLSDHEMEIQNARKKAASRNL